MSNLHTIPILEKSLEVLEYIAAHPGHLSQPELQKALEIPQASCYRIVATLLERNWLRKVGGKYYDISIGILPLAKKVEFQLEPYKVLQPALDRLARKAGYSVKLSVREENAQINVLSAKAPWDIAITTTVGTRWPLAQGGSTAVALLSNSPEKELREAALSPAMMERVRNYAKDGFSFNPASSDPNYRWHVDALSVAVPGESGAVLGALTILSVPGDLAAADWNPLIAEMNKCARLCREMLE